MFKKEKGGGGGGEGNLKEGSVTSSFCNYSLGDILLDYVCHIDNLISIKQPI